MNPDLAKIWGDVVKAKANPADAKDPITIQDADDYLQKTSGGKYSIKDIAPLDLHSLGRSFVMGATLNQAGKFLEGPDTDAQYEAKAAAAPSAAEQIQSGADSPKALQGPARVPTFLNPAWEKIAGLFGGGSAHPEGAADFELRNKAFQREHPLADFGASAVGTGVTSALMPEVAAEAGGAKLIPRMVSGAAKAAPVGAVAGAGAAEPGHEGTGAAVGGVASAVLGGLIPGGAHILKFIGDPLERSNAFIGNLLDEIGYDKLRAALAKTAEAKRGGATYLADLDSKLRAAADWAANKNPDVNMAMDKATLAREQAKPERMAADVAELANGGKEPFAGTRSEGATPGTGKVGAMQGELRKWAAGPEGYGGLPEIGGGATAAPDPRIDALTKMGVPLDKAQAAVQKMGNTGFAGGKSPTAVELPASGAGRGGSTVDAVKAARAAIGNDAFRQQVTEEITKRGGATSPEVTMAATEEVARRIASNPQNSQNVLSSFLARPGIAKTLSQVTGAGFKGVPELGDAPTTKDLVALKGRLDDIATSAFRSGNGNLGAAVADASEQFKNHLIDNVPGFSQVNATYGKKLGGIEAVEAGQDMWTKGDPRSIKEVMAPMSADDKANYQYGLASELTQKLRGPNGLAVARQLQTPGAGMEDRLSAMFGSQANFDAMMKRASVEYQFSQLRKATGNSSTVLRANADAANPLTNILTTAGRNVVSPGNLIRSTLARTTARMASRGVQQAEAEQAGRALMTRGTPAIDALLNSFQARANAPVVAHPAAPLAAAIGSQLPKFLNP